MSNLYTREGHPNADMVERKSRPRSTASHTGLKPDASLSNGTAIYTKQIEGWLEHCDEFHGNIRVQETVSTRSMDDIPLWLIDTRQNCIVPGLSAHRYLALSYVWPETRGDHDCVTASVPRSLLLNKAIVAKFQSPGFLSIEENQLQLPILDFFLPIAHRNRLIGFQAELNFEQIS